MTKFAIFVHDAKPDSMELASKTSEFLQHIGHDSFTETNESFSLETLENIDLAICLGGDGTILRAVHSAAPVGVPVLGVNLGRLGYLAHLEASQLQESLRSFVSGKFSIEERMTLEIATTKADGTRTLVAQCALNEAVVEKAISGHTVRLSVSLGGTQFITYAADGLIVSTATGSTAYNLSARGPLVSPNLQMLLLTPVSPHMLFDRSMVLDPTFEIVVELLDPRPARLVVDGFTKAELQPGDKVVCKQSPYPAKFVVFEPTNFQSILKTKFQLSGR